MAPKTLIQKHKVRKNQGNILKANSWPGNLDRDRTEEHKFQRWRFWSGMKKHKKLFDHLRNSALDRHLKKEEEEEKEKEYLAWLYEEEPEEKKAIDYQDIGNDIEDTYFEAWLGPDRSDEKSLSEKLSSSDDDGITPWESSEPEVVKRMQELGITDPDKEEADLQKWLHEKWAKAPVTPPTSQEHKSFWDDMPVTPPINAKIMEQLQDKSNTMMKQQ